MRQVRADIGALREEMGVLREEVRQLAALIRARDAPDGPGVLDAGAE